MITLETAAPNVGQQLKILRLQRGWSLRDLAQRCGLSFNAISRIERGESSPTVSTLHQLATALNVSITAFFETPQTQSTIFVSPERRIRSQANGVTMESLGIGLHDQQLEPFLVQVEPQVGTTDDPITHSGQEFVYCLSGQIDYQVGDEVFHLQQGDSLLFEANQPHTFFNSGPQIAQVLMVFQVTSGQSAIGQQHLER